MYRAGAHWRTSATPAEPMVCDWDVQTYNYWIDLLEREEDDPKLPRSGIKVRSFVSMLQFGLF
jgi:D-amino-acid oxidase